MWFKGITFQNVRLYVDWMAPFHSIVNEHEFLFLFLHLYIILMMPNQVTNIKERINIDSKERINLFRTKPFHSFRYKCFIVLIFHELR